MKNWIGVLLTSLLLLAVADVDFYIGYPVLDEQWYILILMVSLAYAFPKFAIPLVSLGVGLFLYYPYLAEYANYNRGLLQTISLPILFLIVVSTYRTSGAAFGLILISFLIYGFSGHGREINPLDLVTHLIIDNTAMLGISISIMCGIVFVFIAIGQVLLHSGVINLMVDFIIQRVKSPARVAILSSAVFGSISGSAVANVMSTGQLTIPMMIRSGMTKVRAAAYEAVASTGGQLMPPIMGAAAFLMAEMLMISYYEVVMVSILPALIFYVILLIFAPRAGHLKYDWPKLVFKLNRISIKDVAISIADAIYGLIILSAAIGLIIGVMDQTGLSYNFTSMLLLIAEDNKIVLLTLTALVCIVLGMGMPTSSTYLIVAIIAAPGLIEVGFTPIYAHLFVLYFGVLSMVTPPVALSAFAAAKIADCSPIKASLMSVYLALPLFVLPFIFVWF